MLFSFITVIVIIIYFLHVPKINPFLMVRFGFSLRIDLNLYYILLYIVIKHIKRKIDIMILSHLEERMAKLLVTLTTKVAFAGSILVTGNYLYDENECFYLSLGYSTWILGYLSIHCQKRGLERFRSISFKVLTYLVFLY